MLVQIGEGLSPPAPGVPVLWGPRAGGALSRIAETPLARVSAQVHPYTQGHERRAVVDLEAVVCDFYTESSRRLCAACQGICKYRHSLMQLRGFQGPPGLGLQD